MLNIVLFQPEIPSNTGNIIRTCASIGAKLHLIKPLGFVLDDKELKRASMDYIKLSDITIYDDFNDFLFLHQNDKMFLISRYGKKVYSDANFKDISEDIYLVFGKESSGLPHSFLKENEKDVYRIPMKPEARSLNLSNSVSIVAYECMRQQNFYNLSTFEAIKGMDFINEE